MAPATPVPVASRTQPLVSTAPTPPAAASITSTAPAAARPVLGNQPSIAIHAELQYHDAEATGTCHAGRLAATAAGVDGDAERHLVEAAAAGVDEVDADPPTAGGRRRDHRLLARRGAGGELRTAHVGDQARAGA